MIDRPLTEEEIDEKVKFLMGGSPRALRECMDVLAACQVQFAEELRVLKRRVHLILGAMVIGTVCAALKIVGV